MNTPNSRTRLLDKFKNHLPSVLYTEVPLPAFLTTPIPELFKANTKQTFTKTTSGQPTALNKFLLEGEIAHGSQARFAINGKDFEIDGNTWIIGNVEFGAIARVKGCGPAEQRVATQIVVLNAPQRN